jgi:calcineurin-like phosphoesterase family protein
MMGRFFVEFRFYGDSRNYIKHLTYELARRFRVRGAIKPRPVPHMTLYGPSEAQDIRRVFAAIENAASEYTLVPFRIDGFETKDASDGRVIALRIGVPAELDSLRRRLAEELASVSTQGRWDTRDGYWFHSTIAFKDIDRKSDDIWRYLTAKQRPLFDQYLVRITVLGKGRRIIREYDLVLKKWLTRSQVLLNGRYWRCRTEGRLRDLRGLSVPSSTRRSTWRSMFDFLETLGGKKLVYLVADTHFDHDNIIKYCNRPFNDVQEMNSVILGNWNQTVGPEDTVYHLGDWSHGRGSRPPSYWRGRLRGRILSVQGDHDERTRGEHFRGYRVLRYGGHSFLLVHDPDKTPFEWQGWVIHGHKHNNQMQYYPFINGERKTINVSVELIGYKPISMDRLMSLELDSIRSMPMIESQPERW